MTTTTVFLPLPDARALPPAPGVHPAVPAVPRGAVGLARAVVAQAFLSRAAARLPIRVQAPDGRLSGAGGPRSPVLMIRDQDAFYRRLGSGTAGLAEAYMTGAWDCDDLPGLFTVLASNITTLVPAPLQALRRWYIPRQPAAEDATIDGARRNIQRHYDLSDDLFAAFLDPSMTYSSGLFAPGDSLADAQRRKIDALLDRTEVGQATSVLEIGTGWGELAIRAAAAAPRSPRSPSHHHSGERPAAAPQPPASRTGSTCNCGTTAEPSAATTWCSAWK
jgi:cyclopropane-fatty-acyl-phospholipid synthase